MYPWSSDPSFKQVMKIIDPYSDVKPSISQYELARDRLILWQVKSPTFDHLPEIEATLSLISAVLKDRNIFGEEGEVTGRLTHKYYDICTFYGMSIVKFCNLLPYYEMTKKKKINRVIKKSRKTVRDLGLALDLPSWVLECRHATCHASTNSLILLRQANTFCLTWIYCNYWAKIVEEEAGRPECDDLDKLERQVEVWITLHSQGKSLKKQITNLTLEKPEQTVPIIVEILVRESSKKLPRTDMDLGELPFGIVKFYAKVIRLIHNTDFLELFIHHLTRKFDDSNPKEARISVLWFKVITRCLANQADENVTETLSLPQLDPDMAIILWQRILYKAIRKLTKHTFEIVDHLSNLIPTESVPEKIMDLLIQLAIQSTTVTNEKKTDSNKSDESKEAKESGKLELFTVEDLVNSIKSLEPMDTS